MTWSKRLESFSQLFVSRNLGERDLSVDALRGLAIVAMILVNHGPPSSPIYGPLVHSPWIGWTMADTIFPIFLFLVGYSIAFSSAKGQAQAAPVPYARIFRRTMLLFVINIFLVNFPYYEIDNLVLTGTLSRIGYCYFVVALISYHLGSRGQLSIALGILVIQWWFLTQFNVPGIGAGVLTVEGNASSYLDTVILGSFADRLMLNGPIVQGLLPSSSAISSTLIGVVAGKWMLSVSEKGKKTSWIFVVGLSLFVAGALWGLAYPVSKILWTGSYVIQMTGLAMILLALLEWSVRMDGLRRITAPFQIAGANALFFYVFAQLFQRFLVYGRIEGIDGTSIRLRYFIYDNWIEPWADGKGGALLYALAFLSICYLVVLFLYRRRIFIKL